MITFKIYTLGCKANQYDSNRLAEILISHNYQLASKRADIVIINTCSVTKVAIIKDQRVIRQVKKEHPKAKIVVMGCWAKTHKIEIPGVDLVWGVRNLHRLVKRINLLLGLKSKVLKNNCLISGGDKSRYFIKIQDGCRQFCSYCIIPYTRGPLKSRSPQEILEEIEAAIQAGYREVILSGIHLGLYGVDLKNKINLVGLLKKIIKIPELGRVRLSSIEITEVPDELIELMKKSRKICRHLHISLQSGSDKILKLMNRPYTTKYFFDRVKKLRKFMPEIALTTDIIVGFPGETEKDFLDTYNFAQKINFSKIHVFSFSAHEKTPAFKMLHQVKPEAIKERSKKLRSLSLFLENNYNKFIFNKFKNKYLEVTVENFLPGKIKGKTEYYNDIYFNKKDCRSIGKNIEIPGNLLGKIIKVRIVKAIN